MTSRVLVTGGAGYIGSHMLLALQQAGACPLVVDDLSTGSQANLIHGDFIKGNLQEQAFVERIFEQHTIHAVIHFAASTSVPESMAYPERYYANNVIPTIHLLNACVKHKVQHFVFSSTAAVYGNCGRSMVDETCQTKPINPYGESKKMCEIMIHQTCQAHGLNAVILRYFNVAGVDASMKVGPRAAKSAHLIKAVVDTALGRQPAVQVFGNDYPTEDGTGIRDFIHVNDLCQIHLMALDYLSQGGQSQTLNCGYGHGYSVLDVIEQAKSTLGIDFETQWAPRRDGDIAKMVAICHGVQNVLGWEPKWSDLSEMIRSYYQFEQLSMSS